MNLSVWSIKNPIPTILFFIFLTFGGMASFLAMKVQYYPDINLPTIIVTTSMPGASPIQLENEVVRKIENSIASVQGLKHITSKIVDSSATITAEFRIEKLTQEALDEVRSAVSSIRADLPSTLRDPLITKLDLAGSPILAFTVSSSALNDEELSRYITDVVSKRILMIRGVGAISLVGGVVPEISIKVDPARLAALGLSSGDVSRQLSQIQQDLSGGRVSIGSTEKAVRVIGSVRSATELGEILLPTPTGQSVRIKEIAQISEGIAESRSLALLNGVPVIGFEITRSRGASETEVGDAVRSTLIELAKEDTKIKFTEVFDFVSQVNEEFKGSLALLYEGAILAVMVVWFFLRDWRATFISAVALPLSVIPAFIGMYLLGFSLNVITLLALSLVVGILVDDAIVEVENIVRHLRMGKTPIQAAIDATNEIGLAVIATTFTLIAVFLPTAFMTGIAGKFFKQFGWAASLAVFASLLVARMLTPLMAAYMLKKTKEVTKQDGTLLRTYLSVSGWCLKHRFITALGAITFFIGSIMLVPLLPTGFIPPDENAQTQVHIELPPGSTIQQTREIAEQARNLLQQINHIKSVYTTIGSGSAGSDPFMPQDAPEIRKATLTVMLESRKVRTQKKQAIEEEIRVAMTSLPGARIRVGLGASGEKYAIALTGNNPETLTRAALLLERDLRTIPGLGGITSSATLFRPELLIQIDYARAANLGVSTKDIADAFKGATTGEYDIDMPTKLNQANRQIPIIVKLDNISRADLRILEQIRIPSIRPDIGSVTLNQVASFELGSGPAQIDRYDRARNINFEIELSNVPLGEAVEAIKKLPAITNLPSGVSQIEIGDAEIMDELFTSFTIAMLTGVLCIFIVLILLFKDVMQPVTILAALPLSLGGAFIALLVTKNSLSMPSLIGLIMLMGVVTKNSILLVEYAILSKRLGKNRLEALIDACQKRAKPIVMTTLAMGAGMLPVALGLGDADPSFRSPMGIVVMGGLITSTILSLIVIPVFFTYMDDLYGLIHRQIKKLRKTN